MLLGIFIAAGVMLLLGLALGVVGLRGRVVDDHPLCRRCGFDLFGKPAGSTRCPECGSDVSHSRGVRIGHRRRRGGLIGLAAVIFLPALLALGGGGWAAVRHFDFQPYKPVWLLVREIDSPGGAAMAELLKRTHAGKLSKPQLADLAARGLTVQGDRTKPWDAQWLEFIDAARTAGALDDTQWNLHWRQMFAVTLQVRPLMNRSLALLPMDVRAVPDRGMSQFTRTRSIEWQWELTNLKVGGIECEAPKHEWFMQYYGMCATGKGGPVHIDLPTDKLAKIADGPQAVHAEVVVNVMDPKDRTKGLVTLRYPVSAQWTLLPTTQPSVTVVHDSSKAKQMADAWTVTVKKCYGEALDFSIDCTSSPASFAFRIFARQGLHETELVSLTAIDNIGTSFTRTLPSLAAGPIDIVLRPDATLAETDLAITKIWGDEVVLKDIPVPASQ